jgi:hypothetical protein
VCQPNQHLEASGKVVIGDGMQRKKSVLVGGDEQLLMNSQSAQSVDRRRATGVRERTRER